MEPDRHKTPGAVVRAQEFTAAPAALAVLREDGAGRLRVDEVNPAFAAAVGADPGALSGRSLDGLFDDADVIEAGLRDAAREGRDGDAVTGRVRSAGVRPLWAELRPAFLSARDDALIVALSDVTELRETERALVDCEGRLDHSERRGAIASYRCRMEPELEVAVSPQMHRLLGWRRTRALADFEDWLAVVHPADRALVRAALENWRHPSLLEYAVRHEAGHYLRVEVDMTPLLDAHGLPVGFGGTLLDVTRLRAAEAAVERGAAAPVPDERGERVLTVRERQVLTLVAAGCANAEIAAKLHLGTETVKSHLQRIYARLGAEDRAHAVAIGMRTGEIT